MCQEVLENAHIERANGTIKNEYLHHWEIKNLKDLKIGVQKAVNNYNERSHNSLRGEKTPISLKLLSKIFQMEKESRYESLPIKENLGIILIKYRSLKIYNGLTLVNLCEA